MSDNQDKNAPAGMDKTKDVSDSTQAAATRSPGWTTAYYAGWRQGSNNDDYLRAEQIDYSALTHIIHFVVKPAHTPPPPPPHLPQVPPSNHGALELGDNRLLTEANSTALLRAAHAAGVKVLFSIGGDGTINDLIDAASDVNRECFITNLVNFMTNNNAGYGGHAYDGIDVDWEPMGGTFHARFPAFIRALRQRLNTITPRPLLTASAVGYNPAASIYAPLQDQFDQINIMTYVMAGPWNSSVWFNSAISGSTPPNMSVDSYVHNYLAAGVQPGKLGIAITFYGQHWSGVTQPRTPCNPDAVPLGNIDYSEIMNCYYEDSRYHWDEPAQAAYLSISGSNWVKDCFISYDNEMSIQRKIDYIRMKGLGGVIIWELSQGWRPGRASPDPLLKAVKNATRLNSSATEPSRKT
jgi:chitinase